MGICEAALPCPPRAAPMGTGRSSHAQLAEMKACSPLWSE